MEREFELSMMDSQQFLFAFLTRFQAERGMVAGCS
jgi:hypothetical protein